MTTVFVSSKISGYEAYREAAKKAVELMGMSVAMAETFGARPYSSETACIHEVEQSDVYLLVMGKDYGYETEDGISVTQAEFRAAKKANRPILAFIQSIDMDKKQAAFLQEVEDFQEGFFRARFSSPEELKDSVITAVRSLETMSQAVPEEELNDKIKLARKQFNKNNYDDDPELVLAFLPQPERQVDIVGLEDKLDDYFQLMCQNGLASMREGYKSIEEKDWTGIEANNTKVGYFTDGMIVLQTNPVITNDSLLSGRFAPPNRLMEIAIGFKSLINANSGYTHIGLYHMNNTYVAPLPDESTFTMRLMGENEAFFNRIFAPLTEGAYRDWLEHCIKRFSRVFKYK